MSNENDAIDMNITKYARRWLELMGFVVEPLSEAKVDVALERLSEHELDRVINSLPPSRDCCMEWERARKQDAKYQGHDSSLIRESIKGWQIGEALPALKCCPWCGRKKEPAATPLS